MRAMLVTWNPDKWDWGSDYLDAVERTARGGIVSEPWSTGNRTGGVGRGDRAFLLRQGLHGRGIIGSGVLVSDIGPDEHWDGSGRDTNYADMEWDMLLLPEDALPIETLRAALPGQHWAPQASGSLVRPALVQELERLWSEHVVYVGRGVPLPPGSTAQRRQQDPIRRKKVEDAAQERLMKHYRNQGWEVEDTHIGHPYDALATRGSERLFLEAKGTESSGEAVLVTPNEVAHVRANPGECVMGIWAGVTLTDEVEVDPRSGHFRVLPFAPDTGSLQPTGYEWRPTPP